MKILLVAINAKYIHSNPAVYSLKASAGKYGDFVDLAEYTINQRTEEIRKSIYHMKPDVLAFSCYIWNIAVIREILEDIHKILPDIPIWLGGPEASYKAKEYLKMFQGITGVMVGEGEITFQKLVEAYVLASSQGELHDKITRIPGIVTRDFETGFPEVLPMNDIPFWYENQEEGAFENRIIYYESQRGCPFRCSYCLSSIDKKVRYRDLDKVYEELKWFLDRKVSQVKFIDRTFNCKEEHALSIWNFIHENDNGITNFHFEIAADLLTEAEIEVLKKMRPGLVQLEIGVQTTNTQTLKAINRVTDLEKLWKKVAALHENRNIHLHLDLIAGLPYEDIDSFIRSFNEVYSQKPDELQLGFLKVLGGSPISLQQEEFEIKHESNPPFEVFSTKWISYDDILRLKDVEEMLEVFFNSRQFENTIAYVEKQFESPFALYEALAKYYEKKGYFISAPSRNARYEIFYQFCLENSEKNLDLTKVKEKLLHDMYLRENLKSRPSFAPDVKEKSTEIWEFFRKEEENREYLPTYSAYNAKQLMHMCHMEYYAQRDAYILYDYSKRNPLNNNCVCRIIEKL